MAARRHKSGIGLEEHELLELRLSWQFAGQLKFNVDKQKTVSVIFWLVQRFSIFGCGVFALLVGYFCRQAALHEEDAEFWHRLESLSNVMVCILPIIGSVATAAEKEQNPKMKWAACSYNVARVISEIYKYRARVAPYDGNHASRSAQLVEIQRRIRDHLQAELPDWKMTTLGADEAERHIEKHMTAATGRALKIGAHHIQVGDPVQARHKDGTLGRAEVIDVVSGTGTDLIYRVEWKDGSMDDQSGSIVQLKHSELKPEPSFKLGDQVQAQRLNRRWYSAVIVGVPAKDGTTSPEYQVRWQDGFNHDTMKCPHQIWLQQDIDEVRGIGVLPLLLSLSVVGCAMGCICWWRDRLNKDAIEPAEHWIHEPYVYVPFTFWLLASVCIAVQRGACHSPQRRPGIPSRDHFALVPLLDQDDKPAVDDGVSRLNMNQYIHLRAETMCVQADIFANSFAVLQFTLIALELLLSGSSSVLAGIGTAGVKTFIPIVNSFSLVIGDFLQWHATSEQVRCWVSAGYQLRNLCDRYACMQLDNERGDVSELINSFEDVYVEASKAFSHNLMLAKKKTEEEKEEALKEQAASDAAAEEEAVQGKAEGEETPEAKAKRRAEEEEAPQAKAKCKAEEENTPRAAAQGRQAAGGGQAPKQAATAAATQRTNPTASSEEAASAAAPAGAAQSQMVPTTTTAERQDMDRSILQKAWAFAGILRANEHTQQKGALVAWLTHAHFMLGATIFTLINNRLVFGVGGDDPDADKSDLHLNAICVCNIFMVILPAVATFLTAVATKFIPKRRWAVLDEAFAQTLAEIYLFRARAGHYRDNAQRRAHVLSDRLRSIAESIREELPEFALEYLSEAHALQNIERELAGYSKNKEMPLRFRFKGLVRKEIDSVRLAQGPEPKGLQLREIVGILLAGVASSYAMFLAIHLRREAVVAIEHTLLEPYIWPMPCSVLLLLIWACCRHYQSARSGFHEGCADHDHTCDNCQDEGCQRCDDGMTDLTAQEYYEQRAWPLLRRACNTSQSLHMLNVFITCASLGMAFLASTLGMLQGLQLEGLVPIITMEKAIFAAWSEWYALPQQVVTWNGVAFSLRGLLQEAEMPFLKSKGRETNANDIEEAYGAGVRCFAYRLKSKATSFAKVNGGKGGKNKDKDPTAPKSNA